MKKVSNIITNIDNKVNPKIGKILHKVFKIITLLLATIGVSVIAITFGALALDDNSINKIASIITFFTWIGILLVSSSLWFYFSKWNV